MLEIKKIIKISNFEISKSSPLTVISGPCVIESFDHAFACAKELKDLFIKKGCNLIFKASYDKANRSSVSSFRGPGLKDGLDILERIKQELKIPILTDVHSPEEAEAAAKICDIIQIPAFLCRQTDLLLTAGKTKAIINVKKGQFVAPWDVKNIIDKLLSTGNDNIIITERGISFGYNNLVSDMRSIPIMQKFGYPVCFDSSHSTQLPGSLGSESGGQAEFIPTLSKAAIASGCDLLFIESHPDPKNAKSDKTSVISFENLSSLLDEIIPLYNLIRSPIKENLTNKS